MSTLKKLRLINRNVVKKLAISVTIIVDCVGLVHVIQLNSTQNTSTFSRRCIVLYYLVLYVTELILYLNVFCPI